MSENTTTTTGTTGPTTFAEAEVVLAANLPGYESRPQQQQAARAIEAAIANDSHLLAEAGTGTGKSLAYLIPSILSGKRVVVTTATKALQDQIAGKDLPFLAANLGANFKHAVLKGRANYACQAKLADASGGNLDEVKVAIKSKVDSGSPWDGERETIGVTVTDREWQDITTTSEACPGKRECPFGDTCYSEKAKAKAKEADVVVVNHALFFTDLLVKQVSPSSMLDEYDVVVADEAHELEEWATSMFGKRFTEATFGSLVSEVKGFVSRFLDGSQHPSVADAEAAGNTLLGKVTGLWQVLEAGRLRKPTILANEDEWVGLAIAANEFAEAVAAIDVNDVDDLELKRAKGRKLILSSRASNAAKRVVDIITAPFDVLVRWVEVEEVQVRGQTIPRKSLHSAPIEVGPILKDLVWDQTPAILASATMSVGGDFGYIKGRLGLAPDTDDLVVGTPFDFGTQSGLYIPADLPAPAGKDRAAWASQSVSRMRDLVMASGGRALLLFTSTKQMRTAFDAIAPLLPYTCLMQGGGQSNKALAEEFTADTTSVLFATRSFFTGVDFQGETLSLVVIDKLPFPVPTEPVTEARTEVIEARGGSSFTDYTVPVMSLVLEQGFGRLIRHRTDRGVVAILDPRLETKGYGKTIVRALPAAKRMHSVDEVKDFFEGEQVER